MNLNFQSIINFLLLLKIYDHFRQCFKFLWQFCIENKLQFRHVFYFLTVLTILTILDTFYNDNDNPDQRLVAFETFITILTIENLNSWQSLLPDNHEWHRTAFTILAMFSSMMPYILTAIVMCLLCSHTFTNMFNVFIHDCWVLYYYLVFKEMILHCLSDQLLSGPRWSSFQGRGGVDGRL